MKKILAAIISLAMCAAMFTACGKDADTAEVTDITTTVSETVSKAETSVMEEAETEPEKAAEETTEAKTEAETEKATEAETETEKVTEAETEKATEAETKAETAEKASYSSIEKFVESGDAFSLSTAEIPAGDSLTYDWIRIFEGAAGIYMDVEYFDGSMAMVMGMEQNRMYMYMYEPSSETNMTIILNGGKMYMLDDATKTGYSMTADESIMEEYDVEELLGDIDFDAETENADDVKVAKLDIDGKEYTLEIADTGGAFLFDNNDKIKAIIVEENGSPMALKINDFSGDTPDELFEVPSGYQIIDIDSAQ